MFCSQCGHGNPDGAAFCTACGSPLTRDTKTTSEPSGDAGIQSESVYLQTASFSSPPDQSGFAPPSYPPRQHKKKRAGLIIGLIAGVFLIAAAAVALFVWPGILTAKAPGVAGYWYSEDRGEALEFKNSGSVRVFTADTVFQGRYEYDTAQGMGVITVDETGYEFAMTDDGLKVNGMGLYERAGDNFDVDNFIEDMSSQNAVAATPVPSEEVSVMPSEAPVETAADVSQPDISGIWYETTGYGGTLEFFTDGTYSMTVIDIALGGTYEYNAASSSWNLLEDLTGTAYTAALSGDGYLSLNSLQYTRDFVEQIDWSTAEYAN